LLATSPIGPKHCASRDSSVVMMKPRHGYFPIRRKPAGSSAMFAHHVCRRDRNRRRPRRPASLATVVAHRNRLAPTVATKNAFSHDSFGRTACGANAQAHHIASAGPSSRTLAGDCRVDAPVRTHTGRAHGRAGHGPRVPGTVSRCAPIAPSSRRPEKTGRHERVRTSDPYRVKLRQGRFHVFRFVTE